MTYEQTIEFLYSQLPAYHRIGKAAYKNNLDNTLALDKYFHSPHKKYCTIHIAGTNGKGSVSHLTASILQAAGFKTGLYTSPHLKDFRERIRVDGEMIPREEVVSFIGKHREIITEINPSFFELCVAMAFDFFERSGVEVAVIETGLGGRLDSTNIITPVLSVITNIGHDHFDLLGDTLEKVAAEKAGIIKHGIPVIIGETDEITSTVFRERASEMNSEISFADSGVKCVIEKKQPGNTGHNYCISDTYSENIISGETPLAGDYQAKNLVTVYKVFQSLKKRFNLSDDNFIKGVADVLISTGLQGRWQVLSVSPLTICDTAHNREGLEYVIRQLQKQVFKNLHIVLGFVSDKDLSGVLPLFPANATYYFTKASVQRALDEKILKEKASFYGLKGESYPTVGLAFDAAKINACTDDLIFIGGSTFVVAEVV